jgi:CHAT domain-containing protein
MILMARFYELWKQDGLEPPQALRQAQLWIRDTTNGEKTKYLQTFLPTSDTTRPPARIADTLYKHTLFARPDENDFAHPFYWAAFTYTGV